MTNDIIDDQAHFNSDSLDSKTRIKVSDAIIEVNDHLKKVKFGRYLLFFLAAFNFLLPLMALFTTDEVPQDMLNATLVGVAIIALPFLVFGVLYPKNPLLFLVLGLVVYLGFQVMSVLLLGQSILQGYGWKVAILTAFGISVLSVFNWKNNLEKLRELGYPASAVMEAQKKLKPISRLRKRKKA